MFQRGKPKQGFYGLFMRLSVAALLAIAGAVVGYVVGLLIALAGPAGMFEGMPRLILFVLLPGVTALLPACLALYDPDRGIDLAGAVWARCSNFLKRFMDEAP